jgi:hypothetical protein
MLFATSFEGRTVNRVLDWTGVPPEHPTGRCGYGNLERPYFVRPPRDRLNRIGWDGGISPKGPAGLGAATRLEHAPRRKEAIPAGPKTPSPNPGRLSPIVITIRATRRSLPGSVTRLSESHQPGKRIAKAAGSGGAAKPLLNLSLGCCDQAVKDRVVS